MLELLGVFGKSMLEALVKRTGASAVEGTGFSVGLSGFGSVSSLRHSKHKEFYILIVYISLSYQYF